MNKVMLTRLPVVDPVSANEDLHRIRVYTDTERA